MRIDLHAEFVPELKYYMAMWTSFFLSTPGTVWQGSARFSWRLHTEA